MKAAARSWRKESSPVSVQRITNSISNFVFFGFSLFANFHEFPRISLHFQEFTAPSDGDALIGTKRIKTFFAIKNPKV